MRDRLEPDVQCVFWASKFLIPKIQDKQADNQALTPNPFWVDGSERATFSKIRTTGNIMTAKDHKLFAHWSFHNVQQEIAATKKKKKKKKKTEGWMNKPFD